jgi:radical SAM protein with 4Fe4S-binding SPASM domain
MKDKFLMDSHKMLWHLDRVVEWQNGKIIAPLHIDVGLSKGCNIKCEYCYGSIQRNYFKKGEKIYFPRDALLSYVREAGEVGVRSMAFIGEAEPLLNPHVYEAIIEGNKAGVDIAVGTNGILFDTGPEGEEALEHLTWLRFNISAASDEAYQKIHSSTDFSVAVEKMKFCVETKKQKNLSVTIGMQMVLTPNNITEVVALAKLGKEIGVDYLVVKQCSDTQDNKLGIYNKLDQYNSFEEELKKAEAETTENYRVIIKWGKITNKGRLPFDQCLGVPFLLYSSGDGKIYPCGVFFDYKEEEYRMGDLIKQSFKEILASKRYLDIVEKVKKIDVQKSCYANCRTHSVNDFLWKLQDIPNHVNFV